MVKAQDIALAAGYSDRPHLDRESWELAGRTPGAVRSQFADGLSQGADDSCQGAPTSRRFRSRSRRCALRRVFGYQSYPRRGLAADSGMTSVFPSPSFILMSVLLEASLFCPEVPTQI